MATESLDLYLTVVHTDRAGNKRRWDYEALGSGMTEVEAARKFQVATSTEVTIWDATGSNEQFTDFERLVLVSDQDLDVELVTDVGGENGTEYASLELKANVPLVIGASRAFANYASDVFAGTADNIEQISLKNQSTENTANVTMFLADDT